MIDEARENAAGVMETGAVEIRDEALDQASGGAVYMKVDGLKAPTPPTESLSINFTKIQY